MSNQNVTQANVNSPNANSSKVSRASDGPATEREEPALLPPVDVIEDSTGITLYADLPGVPKDKLDIRVEDETLLINAELVLAVPAGMEASHAEVRHTRYRRAFTLSRELDRDKVAAELSQGVLRVRIPKAAHAQPRRIAVQVP